MFSLFLFGVMILYFLYIEWCEDRKELKKRLKFLDDLYKKHKKGGLDA